MYLLGFTVKHLGQLCRLVGSLSVTRRSSPSSAERMTHLERKETFKVSNLQRDFGFCSHSILEELLLAPLTLEKNQSTFNLSMWRPRVATCDHDMMFIHFLQRSDDVIYIVL